MFTAERAAPSVLARRRRISLLRGPVELTAAWFVGCAEAGEANRILRLLPE